MKTALVTASIALLAALCASTGVWMVTSRGAMLSESPSSQTAPRPVFVTIDPITVPVASETGDMRYLRLGLTLKLADQEGANLFEAHGIEIRSSLELALSNLSSQELLTVEGKRSLARTLANRLEATVSTADGRREIQEVLFTEFIVQ
ncbi:Flagellar biosynthesis protein FliL [Paraburkholderia caribensis MBA4]|uniref:Flagellar protein FliL n=1 Tax=Paraburkholderia caribensis MBA4 TaxID=1323664 RepID=A0A0P0RJT9_9BURK|nr:flagellar basal body-associated FliL family protein [Paraburkholderia caribensis]ALL68945.1 Flagellar biosynthesis protein FliL [Paraburkholderia caribensis MBA4]